MTDQPSFGRRGRTMPNNQRVFRTEVTQPIEVVVTRRGIRWGRVALYAFGLCFVVGVVGNLTEGKPPLPNIAEPAQVAKVKPEAAKKCGATLKEYMSLQTGTSAADAARIIGCQGDELSRVAFGDQETVMLTWPGEAGFFSNMNATFRSGRLVAKAQLGLE
jgi:hypothetical protein